MAGVAGYGFAGPNPVDSTLADRPFSPFRPLEDLNPGELADLEAKTSSLAEFWLEDYADLYRAFAGVMTPTEVDGCEMWQLAALLGMDRKAGASDDPIERLAARVESEKESLARRAAKAGNVQPQVEGEGPVDMTAQIQAAMGIQVK